jgi:hypothetical protein
MVLDFLAGPVGQAGEAPVSHSHTEVLALLARRAPEPHHENANAQTHPPDQCVLEKVGEALCDAGFVLRLVQFLPRASNLAAYPRNRSRDKRSHLGDKRTAERLAVICNRNPFSVLNFRDHEI